LSGDFYTGLWNAIMRADTGNLSKLALGFPASVEAYRAFAHVSGYWDNVQARAGLLPVGDWATKRTLETDLYKPSIIAVDLGGQQEGHDNSSPVLLLRAFDFNSGSVELDALRLAYSIDEQLIESATMYHPTKRDEVLQLWVAPALFQDRDNASGSSLDMDRKFKRIK
jgi:hypothetical protein